MICAKCPVCGRRMVLDGQTLDSVRDDGTIVLTYVTHCADCIRAFDVEVWAQIDALYVKLPGDSCYITKTEMHKTAVPPHESGAVGECENPAQSH